MDFLMEHEHHHMHHDFEHMKIAMAQYYASLLTKLKDHIDDRNVHVTLEEKERWNKKADGLSLEELELKLLKKANISDIPTLISELKNDVPYLTAEALNSKLAGLDYVTWADLKYKDYITADEVNRLIRNVVIDPTNINLYEYVKKSELATVNGQLLYNGGDIEIEEGSGNYTPSTPVDLSNYISLGGFLGKINGYDFYQGNNITIPTSTSSLYTLPMASSTTLGGIKIGFATNNEARKYRVDLEDGKAYVYVPWESSTVNPEEIEYTVYHYELAYIAYTPTAARPTPTLPSNGLSEGEVDNGWSKSAPNSGIIWMALRTVNNGHQVNDWQGPWRISGPEGNAGADGSELEFIYTRSTSEELEQSQLNALSTSPNTDGYIPTSWFDNPAGIDADHPYEWMAMRVKSTGIWGPWAGPFRWSAWGRNGMDGDGVEYIFATTTALDPSSVFTGINNPSTWNDSTSGINGLTFLDREFIAQGSSWSDDPVDLTNEIEGTKLYVCIRKKYAEDNGSPESLQATWHSFSEPKLWSYKAKDGVVSGVEIHIQNQVIPVNFSSDGRNVQFNQTSIIEAWDGSTRLTITNIVPASNKNYASDYGIDISATPSNGKVQISAESGSFNIENKVIPIELVVTVNKNGAVITRGVTISIIGVKVGEDGYSYNLDVSTAVVTKNKTDNFYSPSITVRLKIVHGIEGIELLSPGGSVRSRHFDIQRQYDNNNQWVSLANSITTFSTSDFTSKIKFRLVYSASGNYNDNSSDLVVVDQETVSVVLHGETPASAITYNVIPVYSTYKKNTDTSNIEGLLKFKLTKTEGAGNPLAITKNDSSYKLSILIGQYSGVFGLSSTGTILLSNGNTTSSGTTLSYNNDGTFLLSTTNGIPYVNGYGFVAIALRDSGGWDLKSIVIPIQLPAKDVDIDDIQSLVGKVIRPRIWLKPTYDREFAYNDGTIAEDGIYYIDYAAYGDDWYVCKNEYTANKANAAGPSQDTNSWTKLQNYKAGFFSDLMAKYALIQNLTVNEIVVTDTNGSTVVAGMTSGRYIPTELGSNIENTDGIRIWAGRVENGDLTSAPFTVDSTGHMKANDATITGTLNYTGIFGNVETITEDNKSISSNTHAAIVDIPVVSGNFFRYVKLPSNAEEGLTLFVYNKQQYTNIKPSSGNATLGKMVRDYDVDQLSGNGSTTIPGYRWQISTVSSDFTPERAPLYNLREGVHQFIFINNQWVELSGYNYITVNVQ